MTEYLLIKKTDFDRIRDIIEARGLTAELAGLGIMVQPMEADGEITKPRKNNCSATGKRRNFSAIRSQTPITRWKS